MNASLRRIVAASSTSNQFDHSIKRIKQQQKDLEKILDVARRVPEIATDDSRKGIFQQSARRDLDNIQRVLEKRIHQLELLLVDIHTANVTWNGLLNVFTRDLKEENLNLMTSLLEGSEAEKGAQEVVRLILEFARKY